MSTFWDKVNSPKAGIIFLAFVAMGIAFWAMNLPNGAVVTFAACYKTRMGLAEWPKREANPSTTEWREWSEEEEAHVKNLDICMEALEPLAATSALMCRFIEMESLCPETETSDQTNDSQGV